MSEAHRVCFASPLMLIYIYRILVMFNRKKGEPEQSHSRRSAGESNFNMAAYHRGTTLTNLNRSDDIGEERKKLKRLRAMRRRLVGIMLALFIIVAFGVALLLQYTGHIGDVKLANSGASQLTETDRNKYLRIADAYFAANSFERFSFARRSSVMLQYFQSEAPEVSAVSITPNGLASGRLNVTVRQPVAMWVNGSSTNFVDSTGVVFERNYFVAPSLAIEDNSGVSLGGKMATSSNFLSFIGQVTSELKKQNIDVARVTLPRGSIRYVEFYLGNRTYPFKAQITRDAHSEASDIAVMTRYIDSHNLSPQYVDCRVEGKAYWK